MTKGISNISKCIAIVLVAINSVILIQQQYYLRVFLMLIATILYCMVLSAYVKKFRVFSVSMVFYVMVCFFSMTYCPFIYTNEKLQVLRDSRPEGSITPNDHFNIYIIVSIVLSVLILIYIYFAKIPKTQLVFKPIKASKDEDYCVLFMDICVIYPLAFLVGGETIIAVAVTSFVYFISRFVINHYKFTIPIFVGVALSFVYIFLKVFTNRFQLIKYLLPVILLFVIYYSVCSKKIGKGKVYLLFALGVMAICIYGVVSEVYKLNHSYGQSINLKEIFSNTASFYGFIHNQFYRIFEIWTPLGGNIIELVQREGYFYGLSYIKFFASYLGLPYINLPQISAEYIMASYAQPGLVAEGYANFGIIGAILNIGIVFFLIEFMFRNFMKKRNMLSLMLSIVPFSGILLDGGTLNDAIFNIAFAIITFCLAIMVSAIRPKHHYVLLREKGVKNVNNIYDNLQ